MTDHLHSQASPNALTITFQGLDADTGEMPLGDFLASLAGWRDFIDMASSMFLKSKLTLIRSPDDDRVDIRIARVRSGSVEVDLLTVILVGAAGNFLGNKADKVIIVKNMKKLWKWVNGLFTFHVEQKRTFRAKDEIVAALEALAQQHDVTVDHDSLETQRIVEYTDECLKSATVPIEKSAETVTINNSYINIVVDASARRAIKSAFIVGTRDDVYLPAVVRVRGLSLDTGHTRLEVLQSEHEDFVSKLEKCYIEDPVLKDPGNPYSKSLDTHVPIDVYVARTVDRATGETVRWRIKTVCPTRDLPLLDGIDSSARKSRSRRHEQKARGPTPRSPQQKLPLVRKPGSQ